MFVPGHVNMVATEKVADVVKSTVAIEATKEDPDVIIAADLARVLGRGLARVPGRGLVRVLGRVRVLAGGHVPELHGQGGVKSAQIANKD